LIIACLAEPGSPVEAEELHHMATDYRSSDPKEKHVAPMVAGPRILLKEKSVCALECVLAIHTFFNLRIPRACKPQS
jgi:hypothetical protein